VNTKGLYLLLDSISPRTLLLSHNLCKAWSTSWRVIPLWWSSYTSLIKDFIDKVRVLKLFLHFSSHLNDLLQMIAVVANGKC